MDQDAFFQYYSYNKTLAAKVSTGFTSRNVKLVFLLKHLHELFFSKTVYLSS